LAKKRKKKRTLKKRGGNPIQGVREKNKEVPPFEVKTW